MPLGMELDPNNRWVLKAATIPWDAIDVKYAEGFKSSCGNVAYPLRLALGALIIKATLNFSDEELVLQIQENPYLQYFCGLPGYAHKRPFEQSTVTLFRKRLTDKILGEINEMVIAKALNPKKNDSKNNNSNDNDNDRTETENSSAVEPKNPPKETRSKNKGTLMLDSTCVPQHIRYPLDLSLLDEARRKLEKMIDDLYLIAGGNKPRTYRRKARKDFLTIAKKKNKTKKEIRKAIGKQLDYIKRDMAHITQYRKNGFSLSQDGYILFHTISKLFEQQSEMYKTRKHKIKHRIVSIRQPWIRPIVRGKAKAKVEFGAKIDLSVYKGFARLEHTSFEAYNESENFISEIERFYEREKHYPKRVLADQIYRNRENLKYCSERGIQMLGKPLGRPTKNYASNKRQIRKSEIDRIEIERKIGLAKGSYGMALLKTRLRNTTLSMIAISILAMNIARSSKLLFITLIFIIRNYWENLKMKNIESMNYHQLYIVLKNA
jgi:hypothetical protein